MTAQFKLKVATPCRVSWEQMSGDDRVRACAVCNKDVFNLSTMTRDEAVGLVRAREGSFCARFFQRADGTVMTSDCGVGVRHGRFAKAAALSLLALMWVVPSALASKASAEPSVGPTFADLVTEMRGMLVIGPVVNWLSPEPPVVTLMGDVES